MAAEAAAVEAAAGAASWAEWVESLRAVAEGSVGDGKAGVLRSALQVGCCAGHALLCACWDAGAGLGLPAPMGGRGWVSHEVAPALRLGLGCNVWDRGCTLLMQLAPHPLPSHLSTHLCNNPSPQAIRPHHSHPSNLALVQARLSELEAAVYGVSDKRDDGSSSDGDEGSEEQQEEGEGASEGSEESEQEEEEGQPGAASRSQVRRDGAGRCGAGGVLAGWGSHSVLSRGGRPCS